VGNEWEITFKVGRLTERHYADGWQVGPNGDLLLVNDPYGQKPFPIRAFAAGVWETISLFA